MGNKLAAFFFQMQRTITLIPLFWVTWLRYKGHGFESLSGLLLCVVRRLWGEGEGCFCGAVLTNTNVKTVQYAFIGFLKGTSPGYLMIFGQLLRFALYHHVKIYVMSSSSYKFVFWDF